MIFNINKKLLLLAIVTSAFIDARDRFTIKSDVFIDNWNGLMWEKKARYNGDPESYPEPTYTFNEALKHCSDLVLDGYYDWRTPTREELKKLMTAYFGSFQPSSIDSFERELNQFINLLKSWYNSTESKRNNFLYVPNEISKFVPPLSWSSTRGDIIDGVNGVWVVRFSNGYDYWDYQAYSGSVVCVRDL